MSAAPVATRTLLYPVACPADKWDLKAIVDGRYNSDLMAYGAITFYNTTTGQSVSNWQTTDYVNATNTQGPSTVVLQREDMPNSITSYVNQVVYYIPYTLTAIEASGWASASDMQRDQRGNYTVTVYDPLTQVGYNISGDFPYLDDSSGLRMDGLGLIPDIRRGYRSQVGSQCFTGPDAKLLENTDPSSRNIVGDGHAVLQTDMTKYGTCSEMSVCANRRKQVINGLEYAQGEGGLRLLDEMLVVPMGIIMVEMVKWSSCCGDGWLPYGQTPPTNNNEF